MNNVIAFPCKPGQASNDDNPWLHEPEPEPEPEPAPEAEPEFDAVAYVNNFLAEEEASRKREEQTMNNLLTWVCVLLGINLFM